MGGGGGTKTKYEQSQEQRELYRRGIPMLDYVLSSLGITKEGKNWQFGGPQKPLWDIPDMPSVPGAVLPTSGWMSGIAPEIMAGVKEPFMQGEQQLMETLGAGGQLGGAAGFSGQGAAGLGEYWAKASPQIGLQAWNMVAPEQMRYGQQQWQSELQQRQDTLAASQAPYQIFPTIMGGMSPTFSQGITTQPQNMWERYGGDVMNIGGMAALLNMFSDQRLKNIFYRFRTKISGLFPILFRYKWGGPTYIGFIAQEVEKLYPSYVGEIDGFMVVSYPFTPVEVR